MAETKSRERENAERLIEHYTGGKCRPVTELQKTTDAKFKRMRKRMYELEILVMEQCKQNAVLMAEVERLKQPKKKHLTTQQKDPGRIIELQVSIRDTQPPWP